MSYSWFRRGTCTVTNGSARVDFQNANITTAPNKPTVGDAFMVNNSDLYEIIFIGSDSTGEFVTLDRMFNETSASNAKYAMMRLASSTQNASLVAKASAAINQKQISLDDMYEWYTATTDTVDFEGPDGQAVTVVSYHKLSLDIATVGSHVSEIEIVANNIDSIKVVESDIDSVKAVGADIASVKDASDNMADIKAVNANKANIDHVASESADINTVSSNIVAVKDVARNEANVNIVGGDIQSVNTAAINIDAIKAAPSAAQAAAASAKSASDDANQVSTDKGIVDSDKKAVNAAQIDVTQKHTIVVAKATQVDLDAAQVTQDAAQVALDKASASSSEDLAKKWAVGDGVPPNNVPGNKNNAHYWSEQSKFHSNQTFRFGGFILPVPGNDYPDYASVTRDTQWVIKFDDVNDTYTYTDGPFNGKSVSNGDQIYYDTPSNVLTLVQPPGKGGILEVNGHRGASVVLDYDDVGAAAEVHRHQMTQVDGLPQALDNKADDNVTVKKVSISGPIDIPKGTTATRPDTAVSPVKEKPLLWFNNDTEGFEVFNPVTGMWTPIDTSGAKYASENLLVNSDFQSWEHATSTTGWAWGADQWLGNDAIINSTWSLISGYSMSATRNKAGAGLVTQPIELQVTGGGVSYSPFEKGGVYTIAISISGTTNRIKPGLTYGKGSVAPTGVFTNKVFEFKGSETVETQTLLWTFTVDHPPSPGDLCVNLTIIGEKANNQTIINWVHLGPGLSFAGYTPDNPQLNASKCMRFYEKGEIRTGYASSGAPSSSNIVTTKYGSRKRIAPTISASLGGGAGGVITSGGSLGSGLNAWGASKDSLSLYMSTIAGHTGQVQWVANWEAKAML